MFQFWPDDSLNRFKQFRGVSCTFLHVALQHGSVPEDDGVEDGLAGRVEGPVQADVTAGLFAAAVLAVDVAMDPGEQQVQTGPHSAVGGGGKTEEEEGEEEEDNTGLEQQLVNLGRGGINSSLWLSDAFVFS